jgi:hypothetical protein
MLIHKVRLSLLCYLLFSFTCLKHSLADQQATKESYLREVVVVDSHGHRMDEAAQAGVLEEAGLRVGAFLSAQDLEKAIKNLWRKGYASEVSLAKDPDADEWGAVATIRIHMRHPCIYKIVWRGPPGKKLKKKLLVRLDLAPGKVWHRATSTTIAQNLTSCLRQEGYPAAVAKVVHTHHEQGVELQINVKGCYRKKVTRIYFTGSTLWRSHRLRMELPVHMPRIRGVVHYLQLLTSSLLEAQFAYFFSILAQPFQGQPSFDPKLWREEMERLRQLYRERGYRDVAIRYKHKVQEKGLALLVKIEEGKRYVVDKVSWEANYMPLSQAQLQTLPAFQPGVSYVPEQLERRASAELCDLLEAKGYTLDTCKLVPETISEQAGVALRAVVRVKQAPLLQQIRFVYTKKAKITPQLLRYLIHTSQLKRGQPLLTASLEHMKAALQQTGILADDGVEVEIVPCSGRGVKLVYHLTPKSTFRMNGGVVSPLKLGFTLDITSRNINCLQLLKGRKVLDGQQVQLEFQGILLNQKMAIDLNLQHPWYFIYGRRDPISWQTKLNVQEIHEDKKCYKVGKGCLSLGERKIVGERTSAWNAGGTLTSTIIKKWDSHQYLVQAHLHYTFQERNIPPTFLPATGHEWQWKARQTLPLHGSKAAYLRLMGSYHQHQSWHRGAGKLPLVWYSSLVGGMKVGHSGSEGDFMLGRLSTRSTLLLDHATIPFRGYSATSVKKLVGQHGPLLLKGTVELRHKLATKLPMYGYLYADGGTTSLFKSSSYKLSCGIGACIELPMLGKVNVLLGLPLIHGSGKMPSLAFGLEK